VELRGVLVDPVDGRRPGVLTIEDGCIAAVEETGDFEAPFLFPGFIDLQIYDFAGSAAWGVTGYLATVGTSEPGVVERFLADLPEDPACLGAHIEGPYLSPEKAGAQPAAHMRAVDFDELARWLETGRVRMVTLAPEADGAFEAIECIVAAGAVAAIGHTATNYYTTRAAIERGARFATHLWNAMSGFTARTPGAIGTLLADDRVTLGVIADGRHLHPVTEDVTVRTAGPMRIALTSDMVPPPREDEATGRLHGGDRCGSALVRRVARRYGYPEAAAMASLVPARVLGLEDRGRLALGYRADIAVLAPDFAPLQTVIAGEEVWPAR
jgi:N-acetylglucosamine-6-phosphate deacetylase